ncbi:MAG: hypothetical protein LBU76_02895 [Azoarcus sp.]|jgi:hypothetical protein|nr:hypothetical protein [Azoarcus sp.]
MLSRFFFNAVNIFIVFTAYGMFISSGFLSYPEWANAPVDWLIAKFEASQEEADFLAVAFVAAVHLTLIAIVAALVCFGIKWRMPPEKANVMLRRLSKAVRWFFVGFVVVMALYGITRFMTRNIA